jgi:oxygen-dependent protoporphyrinogen oxidase
VTKETASPNSADVLIIGGGIAGLTAAYDLTRAGRRVMVLDAGPRAGGVIFTERQDGFVIDAGPDSLLVQKPAALELCHELGLTDRLIPTVPPRLAYVLRGGQLYPLPEASVLGVPTRLLPLARSGLFSWTGKLRMAADLVMPRRAGAADESIGAFIGRHFGREAVDYLAEPLLAGIHAGDVDRLSVQALFPRLAQAEANSGSLIREFRGAPRGALRDGAFRSFPDGIGELVDALVGALPAGTVRCRQRVMQIERTDLFTVRTADGEVWRARQIVLATPAWVTADLLAPLDADLGAKCREIPYASTATVLLGYRAEAVGSPLRGSGFVVPRAEGLGLLAGTWVSSKWRGRAPDDHVLLRGFVGGARDPHALDADDERIIERVAEIFGRLLQVSGRPLLARVYRWERATAQYEVGHLDRIAAIERALARLPGISITGSGFRGVGIPDCVADARRVAKALMHEA